MASSFVSFTRAYQGHPLEGKVAATFQRVIAPIYGDQASAIRRALDSRDRSCELMLVSGHMGPTSCLPGTEKQAVLCCACQSIHNADRHAKAGINDRRCCAVAGHAFESSPVPKREVIDTAQVHREEDSAGIVGEPVGLLLYKNEPTDEFAPYGLQKSLEVKTLVLLDPSSSVSTSGRD